MYTITPIQKKIFDITIQVLHVITIQLNNYETFFSDLNMGQM